ncbi:NineTeen Complex (NTC) component [Ceratobasidium sp. 423]|nr:NineTeen Complex (NTC) component [Ceratobasidium sp. 423]
MSDRQSENRAPRVKNRAPAAVQITAEQLLREAQERQESAFKAPRQRVEDFEELHEYRGRKRKEFEERIRRTRGSVKEWQAYALWEASRGDMIDYHALTDGYWTWMRGTLGYGRATPECWRRLAQL